MATAFFDEQARVLGRRWEVGDEPDAISDLVGNLAANMGEAGFMRGLAVGMQPGPNAF